ncbi:RNA polymerase sigma factor [Streptomyces sp. NPDC059443]|uniref:RNA polymerase sigma factor n=1 Tax=unclassified Streptomyces TaxID=2593676 RepID=UPI0036C633BA
MGDSAGTSDGPDAAQEALTVIFKNIGHLHEPAALFGWARAITVREAVRMAHRGPRAVAAELHEVPAPGDPQLAADIRDVLDRLTPEHRAVLTLRDLEGLDEQAVGELLALPVGTVKSADLENELPRLLPDVRSLAVTSADGERLEAYARGYGGVRARFDIVLRPGWCLMQSRFLLGGMAAVPDGDATRFAFLGGFRFPGTRLLRPALRPLGEHYGPAVLRRLRGRLDIG